MSDQFYSYLAEKIIDFFRINPLTPGSKYNIQFVMSISVDESEVPESMKSDIIVSL